MSWRSLQLKQNACAQDQLIFNLFKNKNVKYIGRDHEFASKLDLDDNSDNLIAILNYPMWLSNLLDDAETLLEKYRYKTFYLSVNRYQIMGNDINLSLDQCRDCGWHLINLLTKISEKQCYQITQSGYFDNDLGRHMNWVQPVTWIYGTSAN